MNKSMCSVLIIENQPLIVEVYKNALSQVNECLNNQNFNIDVSQTGDGAFQKIKEASIAGGLDLIILEIRIIPSADKRVISGEDLCLKIRELMPSAKIIIITTISENHRLNNILKTVNPDGLLLKEDISKQEVISAIKEVMADCPYYSKTVVKLMRRFVTNEFILDKISRQLLYEISIGTKMKDMPMVLPMSMAGIEKRKRQLKEAFDVPDGNNKELIAKARDGGYI